MFNLKKAAVYFLGVSVAVVNFAGCKSNVEKVQQTSTPKVPATKVPGKPTPTATPGAEPVRYYLYIPTPDGKFKVRVETDSKRKFARAEGAQKGVEWSEEAAHEAFIKSHAPKFSARHENDFTLHALWRAADNLSQPRVFKCDVVEKFGAGPCGGLRFNQYGDSYQRRGLGFFR